MKQEARAFFDAKLRRIAERTETVSERIFDRPSIAEIAALEAEGKIRKVHISGVCGKATSSLAGLFAEAGYEVSGSDQGCYPPASDLIERLGIKFHEGFAPENLQGKDLVVVANMFGPNDIEAKAAREQGLNQVSMPEAITEFFIKDRTSIVVCGTHGKTTTTGMAAHVFLSAGKNPGFLVGGVAVPTENGIKETSFSAGNSSTRHFIIEGDEYDTAYFDKSPKFLLYKPKISIITSLEFDHADIYADFEEYKQSFIFLAQETAKGGLLILNGDIEEVAALAQYADAQVVRYGFTEGCDIKAGNITVDADGQHFDVSYKGNDFGRFTIKLFGRYNIANALSVMAAALHENLSADEIRAGLSTFIGMKRRQEIRANINGVLVIDDFAHHPTAVHETLAGIKERFSDRRIIALFEPRSNTSRKKMFEDPYSHAFSSADVLCLSMPALRHNDNPADFIDGGTVIEKVKADGAARGKEVQAFCVSNGDEALERLVPGLRSGDVVVIMSNGSFDGVHGKLITALQTKFPTAA
ncbi:MAG TPA: Mur ligase family protein [Candidatus Paceibacterota bacterium]